MNMGFHKFRITDFNTYVMFSEKLFVNLTFKVSY
jgi:hypothetical protein